MTSKLVVISTGGPGRETLWALRAAPEGRPGRVYRGARPSRRPGLCRIPGTSGRIVAELAKAIAFRHHRVEG